jgi:hypothetical protein
MEFLAHWYPIVRDRIPERTSDLARRKTLLTLVERLNPTAWTDADEIAGGLQGAVVALDRLSRVFSKRRRRSRRSATRPAESKPTADVVEPPPTTEPPEASAATGSDSESE